MCHTQRVKTELFIRRCYLSVCHQTLPHEPLKLCYSVKKSKCEGKEIPSINFKASIMFFAKSKPIGQITSIPRYTIDSTNCRTKLQKDRSSFLLPTLTQFIIFRSHLLHWSFDPNSISTPIKRNSRQIAVSCYPHVMQVDCAVLLVLLNTQ